jgi:hypothetical protein
MRKPGEEGLKSKDVKPEEAGTPDANLSLTLEGEDPSKAFHRVLVYHGLLLLHHRGASAMLSI